MSIVILANAFQVAVHCRSDSDPRRLYPPPGRPPAEPWLFYTSAAVRGGYDPTGAPENR